MSGIHLLVATSRDSWSFISSLVNGAGVRHKAKYAPAEYNAEASPVANWLR